MAILNIFLQAFVQFTNSWNIVFAALSIVDHLSLPDAKPTFQLHLPALQNMPMRLSVIDVKSHAIIGSWFSSSSLTVPFVFSINISWWLKSFHLFSLAILCLQITLNLCSLALFLLSCWLHIHGDDTQISVQALSLYPDFTRMTYHTWHS